MPDPNPWDDINLSLPDQPESLQEKALDDLARLQPELCAVPRFQWSPELTRRVAAALAAIQAADPESPSRLIAEILEKDGAAPQSIAALRQIAENDWNPPQSP